MRIQAVINRRAGGVMGQSMRSIERDLTSSFERAGHSMEVRTVDPKNIAAALDAAIASRPGAVVIGGGDGTIKCAAQRLAGSDIALAILPLGTLNRTARDLGIPLDPAGAITALAAAEIVTIDVAEVNGHVFLCNSLMGLPPQISERRQELRGKIIPARIAGYFGILRNILRARRKIEMTIDDDKETRRVRAFSVAISNNPYSEEPSFVLRRNALDTGKLGLYISKHRSGLQLMWVLLRAAFGQWSGDPNFERLTAKTIVIHSKHRHMRLSNDGEVERLDMPLQYRMRPRALRVLVPRKQPA